MPKPDRIESIESVHGPARPVRDRLSPEALAVVARLAARDREVRAHEAAHVAQAGSLAIGGPSFTYQTGPDGKLYAVGGEVRMDLSPGRTPEETLARAARARAAATAPSNPSGADLMVAAQAGRMEAEARREAAAASARLGVTSAAQVVHRPQGLGRG